MMEERLNILMVASELAPYVKTGGLGDMVAALSNQLKKEGHDVRIVLPFYGRIKYGNTPVETVFDSMCVAMGIGEVWCGLKMLKTEADVPVYLLDHEALFDREGLYHDSNYNDYQDNPSRFGFLARAAMQAAIDLKFSPDIVHAHDWQAALTPVYLKTWFRNQPQLGNAASVLTIHNAAYQGKYPASHYYWLGMRPDHFKPDIFEDFGRMNFLKGGIHYADVVNTVSPTHAAEIAAPFSEFGLAPCLSNKGEKMSGILNGVDYEHWSPEIDMLIPARFSADNLAGKKTCKAELQKMFGLEQNPDVALIGLVGRFAAQKGYNLVRDTIERIVDSMLVQVVILGEGAPALEDYFGDLPGRYPGRIGSYIGFSNKLAHCIEAGSDFFLMPSLYEPCGLNQLYSLRYGTLPIVRAVGGLQDSVENYNEKTGEGTGFKFQDPTPPALYYTVGWAVSTYYDRKRHMERLIRQAMEKDFSWRHAVKDYERLYQQALDVK